MKKTTWNDTEKNSTAGINLTLLGAIYEHLLANVVATPLSEHAVPQHAASETTVAETAKKSAACTECPPEVAPSGGVGIESFRLDNDGHCEVLEVFDISADELPEVPPWPLDNDSERESTYFGADWNVANEQDVSNRSTYFGAKRNVASERDVSNGGTYFGAEQYEANGRDVSSISTYIGAKRNEANVRDISNSGTYFGAKRNEANEQDVINSGTYFGTERNEASERDVSDSDDGTDGTTSTEHPPAVAPRERRQR